MPDLRGRPSAQALKKPVRFVFAEGGAPKAFSGMGRSDL
jgi:hypothetical protein